MRIAQLLSEQGRPAGGVQQAMQLGKKWYVALTKPRNEETAHRYLSASDIEVFYPKLLVPIQNNSGRQVVSLFPNYIFVHIDASSSEYFKVAWCRGIKKLVSFGGVPSPLESHIVEFLREQVDEKGLIVARSNLKVGDEVQIVTGPFKGLVGIIQEPPDTKSRVKVLMAILSRHVEVVVPAGCIDGRWVAPCPIA